MAHMMDTMTDEAENQRVEGDKTFTRREDIAKQEQHVNLEKEKKYYVEKI